MSNEALVKLAAEAYLYGYPLVEGVGEMIKNTSGPATVFSGPVNMFAHATKLAGPETDIVTPNNDTLYSFVFADVTREPLVLHLPDTNNRYYVMRLLMPGPTTLPILAAEPPAPKRGCTCWPAPTFCRLFDGWDKELLKEAFYKHFYKFTRKKELNNEYKRYH